MFDVIYIGERRVRILLHKQEILGKYKTVQVIVHWSIVFTDEN